MAHSLFNCSNIQICYLAKLLHINFKVEPADPSSALTGLQLILYPRRADLTADRADYQAAPEPVGGKCEALASRRISKYRCTPFDEGDLNSDSLVDTDVQR